MRKTFNQHLPVPSFYFTHTHTQIEMDQFTSFRYLVCREHIERVVSGDPFPALKQIFSGKPNLWLTSAKQTFFCWPQGAFRFAGQTIQNCEFVFYLKANKRRVPVFSQRETNGSSWSEIGSLSRCHLSRLKQFGSTCQVW